MPIIQDTAPVIYPKTDYSISKYLDLTKFLSLLHKRCLFFTRLDRLEDQYEGVSALSSRKLMLDWYSDGGNISEDEAIQRLNEYLKLEGQYKALTCINCWNKSEGESAALWKIYSEFGKGIMIRSSIGRLNEAFRITAEDIRVSEIRYIDHRVDRAPAGNTFFATVHKHKAYQYEDEVRLMFLINPPSGFEHDWSNEELDAGKYISVNLEQLIDEIVLGPFSPNWLFELINDILGKYGLTKSLKKSQLGSPL